MHHCEDIRCFQYSSTMSLPLFVIVIARGQGFMAVNEPSPRAKPQDKVCLRCHKSLATRAITVIWPTWLVHLSYTSAHAQKYYSNDSTNKPTQKGTWMMACSFSPYSLGMCEWTVHALLLPCIILNANWRTKTGKAWEPGDAQVTQTLVGFNWR